MHKAVLYFHCFVCSVLNIFQLPTLQSHLHIRQHKDMVVHATCAFQISFNFQLDTVLNVDQPCSASVHRLVRHGAQINEQTKLVCCEVFFRGYVLRPADAGVGVVLEVPLHFFPEVFGLETVGKYFVWRAFDGDFDFCEVREDVFFAVSCASSVRLNEQQQDSFERSSVRVDFEVDFAVGLFFQWHNSFSLDVIVRESFARKICIGCLFWEKGVI